MVKTLCPICHTPISPDVATCPHCRINLRLTCVYCGMVWRVCNRLRHACPRCGELQPYPQKKEVPPDG